MTIEIDQRFDGYSRSFDSGRKWHAFHRRNTTLSLGNFPLTFSSSHLKYLHGPEASTNPHLCTYLPTNTSETERVHVHMINMHSFFCARASVCRLCLIFIHINRSESFVLITTRIIKPPALIPFSLSSRPTKVLILSLLI